MKLTPTNEETIRFRDFTIRSHQYAEDGMWCAQAKYGPFVAENIFHEKGPCWFEYGMTREQAIERLILNDLIKIPSKPFFTTTEWIVLISGWIFALWLLS